MFPTEKARLLSKAAVFAPWTYASPGGGWCSEWSQKATPPPPPPPRVQRMSQCKSDGDDWNCRTLLHMCTRMCVCGALFDLRAACPTNALSSEGGGGEPYTTPD